MNTFFDEENKIIYIIPTSEIKPIKAVFESDTGWKLKDINENGDAIFTRKLTEEEKRAFVEIIQKVNAIEGELEND